MGVGVGGKRIPHEVINGNRKMIEKNVLNFMGTHPFVVIRLPESAGIEIPPQRMEVG